jgi:hypothetical protein
MIVRDNTLVLISIIASTGAQRGNKSKSNFLAVMSHKVRTAVLATCSV